MCKHIYIFIYIYTIHIVQELVAKQLGYKPDELFQIEDVSELGPVKKRK